MAVLDMTNNSWSRTNSVQYQQFVVTRFRAIEARRSLIAATVSGLTTVVDRNGETLASLPMFEQDSLPVLLCRIPAGANHIPTSRLRGSTSRVAGHSLIMGPRITRRNRYTNAASPNAE